MELQDQLLQDWRKLDIEFQAKMSFHDYVDVRLRHRPHRGERFHNHDL